LGNGVSITPDIRVRAGYSKSVSLDATVHTRLKRRTTSRICCGNSLARMM